MYGQLQLLGRNYAVSMNNKALLFEQTYSLSSMKSNAVKEKTLLRQSTKLFSYLMIMLLLEAF
jgi:hypothetical protein